MKKLSFYILPLILLALVLSNCKSTTPEDESFTIEDQDGVTFGLDLKDYSYVNIYLDKGTFNIDYDYTYSTDTYAYVTLNSTSLDGQYTVRLEKNSSEPVSVGCTVTATANSNSNTKDVKTTTLSTTNESYTMFTITKKGNVYTIL